MLVCTRAPARVSDRTAVSITTLAAVDETKSLAAPLADTLTSTASTLGARNFPHALNNGPRRVAARPRRITEKATVRFRSPRRKVVNSERAAVGGVRENPAADAWVLSAEPRRVLPAVEHSLQVRWCYWGVGDATTRAYGDRFGAWSRRRPSSAAPSGSDPASGHLGAQYGLGGGG